MAEFSVNVVTTAGLALIARAAAASQLIYTRVLSDADAMTAAAAALATPADFSGPEGTILAASATDVSCRVVGRIGNQSAATSIKTFAVCAKIDGDASDVVVAVLSDNAEIPIPDTSSPITGVEIGFLINISNADTVTVQVTGAGSVTFGDLERFVSCHKAGDPTTGEQQTILGAKRFENGADFGAGVGIEGELVVGGSVEMNNELLVDGQVQFNNNVHVYGELGILGDPSIDNGDLAVITQFVTPDSGSGSTLTMLLDWPHIVEDNIVFSVGAKMVCQGLEASGDAAITGTCTINGELTVETVSEFKDEVAFNGNATFDLGLTSNDVITSLSAIVVKDDTVRVFDSSDRLKAELSASGLNVSNSSGVTTGVLNADTGNLSIAGTARVGGISGVAPYRDSSNNLVIPVGAPVLAYIPKQSGASVSKKVGEIVQPSDFNPQPQTGFIYDDGDTAYAGNPDRMGSADSENIPAGKYACLSSIRVSGAQGALVWLKRVPD